MNRKQLTIWLPQRLRSVAPGHAYRFTEAELERFVGVVLDELAAAPGSVTLLGRHDDEPMSDEVTTFEVQGVDWTLAEAFGAGADEPVEYWIRRYAVVDEFSRTIPEGGG